MALLKVDLVNRLLLLFPDQLLPLALGLGQMGDRRQLFERLLDRDELLEARQNLLSVLRSLLRGRRLIVSLRLIERVFLVGSRRMSIRCRWLMQLFPCVPGGVAVYTGHDRGVDDSGWLHDGCLLVLIVLVLADHRLGAFVELGVADQVLIDGDVRRA